MLYKLSFTKTADGLLRVSASVGRASEHVIAIYQSDLAFLHLLKHAGLTQEAIDKLERASLPLFRSANRFIWSSSRALLPGLPFKACSKENV